MITLNLLPPTQHTAIKKERIYSTVENFLSIFLVVLIVIASLLFLIKKTLEKNLSELARQGVQANIKTSELNNKIQEINDTLKVIEEIQKKTKTISPFVLEFSQIIPKEVKTTSFQVNTEDSSVKIKGLAKTRNALLKFKKNLEASDKFTDVKVPLSNLLEKEDIEFEISCVYY